MDRRKGERIMGAKILFVEDDEALAMGTSYVLESEGMQVIRVDDCQSAKRLWSGREDQVFDLVLLDVMLPKADGFEVLQTVREFSEVPVIMLTARNEEYDKLTGFGLGVDDYVSKPFSPKELMARVGAVLKRNGKKKSVLSYQYKELEIHPDSRIASISGKELILAPKEFDLLLELAKNPGTVMRRDKLLQDVWGYSYCGDGRTVDTHVKSVRDRLGPYRSMIQTVWGVGYKFDPDAAIR